MAIVDWSEQERQEVLQFFGLDSLEPEHWIEMNEEQPESPIEEQEESGRGGGNNIQSNLMGFQQGGPGNRPSILSDSNDPLGTNDAAYLQQLRLKEQVPQQAELEDGKSKRSLSINSINFHPRHFIRQVHRDTSYADLLKGVAYLQRSIDQRNETVKNMVKENFSRFINAKNSVELVFNDMKQRGLTSSDHGLTQADRSLQEAFLKAQQVFQPLLARREQEELLRKRLQVYEKYSFILSLGGRFEKYIKLGDFQQASYDYRKAKALMMEVDENSGFKRVLDRTWHGHLAKALEQIRTELFQKLSSPIYSYDVHSKMIEYLLELDAEPDPATFFMDHCRSNLLGQVNKVKEHALDELKEIKKDQLNFKKILEFGKSKDYESIINNSGAHCWRIRKNFFSSISELFASFAPAFSKFTTALFEGRLQPSITQKQADKKVVGDQMAGYISKLKHFAANLSDTMIQSFKDVLSDFETENCIISCNSVLACICSIQSLYLTAEDASMSDIMTDAIKQVVKDGSICLTQRIWTDASNDLTKLPSIASWSLGGEFSENNSALLNSFEFIINQVLTTQSALINTFQERFGESLGFPELNRPIHDETCDCILSFVDALSGVKVGSSDEGECSSVVLAGMGHGYRLLIILTNLFYLQQNSLQQLCNIYSESSFGDLPSECLDTAADHVDDAFQRVTDQFISLRHGSLEVILQDGLENFDWQTEFAGRGIRPYVDRLLSELICIQNEILDVSPAILRHLMICLTRVIFAKCLQYLGTLKNISFHAYLQARLEIDFIGQKLVTAIDTETESVIGAIEERLSQLVAKNMQGTMEDVEQVLDSKIMILSEKTALQYCCFKYT